MCFTSYTLNSIILHRNNLLPPVIQSHLDRMSEQIDDLALQLAEERLNHKQTRAQVYEVSTTVNLHGKRCILGRGKSP